MDMFGYDPRQSPFLPSGYEASSDLPDDLDSVIVPSIRSKDIVFHKNEDESFKEIGRGSYGVVYLGHLLKTSKQIVIHNDVKADNILVDLDGFDVRFIDFGMSTFRKGLEFTASPDYMSKFQFLAPEVRENCHSTPQSDVFSLGFLFELAVGTFYM
ncbi:uncharacterized protein LOC126821556 [Patella vulgata]|uniref:uncharacterized protein LOC126821556 n=1 Tax=Patella vulgata TaxID=6465 RepID=UPI00217FB28E|nr:uncharacterized protein LOC126821556 [Patella vulgata]